MNKLKAEAVKLQVPGWRPSFLTCFTKNDKDANGKVPLNGFFDIPTAMSVLRENVRHEDDWDELIKKN